MNRRINRSPRPTQAVETSGRNVEEAVRAAAQKLRVPAEQLVVEVLEEGRGGFLGLGAREARVRAKVRIGTDRSGVTPDRRPMGREMRGGESRTSRVRAAPESRGRRDAGEQHRREPVGRQSGENAQPRVAARPALSPKDQERQIMEYSSRLLECMGFPSRVEVAMEDDTYVLRVEAGEDDALLIGRGGETLDALQHLITKAAGHGQGDRVPVRVDIAGYRHRREEQLVQRAVEIAAQVRRTGRAQTTLPYNAAERRTIHRALAGEAGIHTRALGEGLMKKILIEPAEGAAGPPRRMLDVEETASREEGLLYQRPPGGPPQDVDKRLEESFELHPSGLRSSEPVREMPPGPELEESIPPEGEGESTSEEPDWGRKPRPARRRLGRR